jgi:hypothetical protein
MYARIFNTLPHIDYAIALRTYSILILAGKEDESAKYPDRAGGWGPHMVRARFPPLYFLTNHIH